MLLSLAWKNIWRKPTRSLVLITAILIGLSGGVFAISLTEGMLAQRNKDEININYGHIQIHNPEFPENMKMNDSIKNCSKLVSEIKADSTVKGVSSRLKFFGLASTARDNKGVMIYGVNPEDEMVVSDLYKHLIDSNSTFFGKGYDNEILISSSMAQDLKLVNYTFTDDVKQNLVKKGIDVETLDKLNPIENKRIRNKKFFKDSLKKYLSSSDYEKFGDLIVDNSSDYKLGKKIILRFNNTSGLIVDEAFKVTGIFKTSDAMFDKMNVFVRKSHLAEMAGVGTNVSTEIIIKMNDIKKTDQFAENLAKENKGLKIQTYKELDPFMLTQSEFIHIYYYIMIGFILFALSFGIINTVLMSVMERTKELGMLTAVGMKRSRTFNMIMLESVLLSLTGGILGMIVGATVSQFFHFHGLNMAAYAGAWESYGFDSTIYPLLRFDFLLIVTVLVILTGIVSALYPARRALKLNPAEALRSDV